MKALTIDTKNRAVKEIELEMGANTIYTFFNSILTDELTTLKDHILYTDANALSQKKPAYFIGEQLLIGDALIFSRVEFNDEDVRITKAELESLMNYEINSFYTRVLELLSQTDINLYRVFTLKKESQELSLNTEWVLYTFNIADIKTQEYFIDLLSIVVNNKESVELFIQKMAGLALNSVEV